MIFFTSYKFKKAELVSWVIDEIWKVLQSTTVYGENNFTDKECDEREKNLKNIQLKNYGYVCILETLVIKAIHINFMYAEDCIKHTQRNKILPVP